MLESGTGRAISGAGRWRRSVWRCGVPKISRSIVRTIRLGPGGSRWTVSRMAATATTITSAPIRRRIVLAVISQLPSRHAALLSPGTGGRFEGAVRVPPIAPGFRISGLPGPPEHRIADVTALQPDVGEVAVRQVLQMADDVMRLKPGHQGVDQRQ